MDEKYTKLLERQVEILLWFTSNTLRTSFSMDYYLVILESFYDKIRDYHMELVKTANAMSEESDGHKENHLLRKLLDDWEEFIPKIHERILELRSKQPHGR